ncbi:hypothetical protein [Leptolyngbya sp. FACHB-16]|uniref:hypothetical protein n=1 Tax=unclassified Leptolyngbya TaxID=2650499 RepID=UPI001684F0D9|nr:hypothetical protein [Leptolyngbya sp. FACHB-16]MBD2153149.1 hypothetical protein [Leptolyngbya sp. FACHB-16]
MTISNSDRIAELMALTLKEFAQATKHVADKPCAPGLEPKAFLVSEPQFAEIPVTQLGVMLVQKHRRGLKIFSGWAQLAVRQAANEGEARSDRQ